MSDTPRDLIKCSISNTPGTASGFTINAAVSGSLAFTAADDGLSFKVNATESGVGTELRRGCVFAWNGGSGSTLTRGTVVRTTGTADAALNFTSATVVSVVAMADLDARTEMALKAVTPGGLLTLESGVPISTTDQIAKTDIFYCPYLHNIINLWDGSEWKPISFTEYTLALGTLTSGKPYDIFAYLSSGALALEVLVWTDDTTRATAVTLQDGRYCKSGDKTRLLLGSFYTTATTTTEDSESNRYLSNAYNRVSKLVVANSVTSHTYTTGAFRESNAGSGVTRGNFMAALTTEALQLQAYSISAGVAVGLGYVSIGLDSTTAMPGIPGVPINSPLSVMRQSVGFAVGPVAPGKHYITLIEYGSSGVTYSSSRAFGAVPC